MFFFFVSLFWFFGLCRRTYGDGTASYYNALAKYNGISNPHLIYVGQTIKLPPKDILLGGG